MIQRASANRQANPTFTERGIQTISTDQPTGRLIPLGLDAVVFRQMFDYAVVEFETEVGFCSEVFGFSVVPRTSGYAVFTTPDNDFHVSFTAADEQHAASTFDRFKLLFMSADFASAEAHIRSSGLVDAEVRHGSPGQRVLYMTSPAGLPIEIWEDPSHLR